MKTNRFRASVAGSKKTFAVSILMTLILASLSVIGAFAASTTPPSQALTGTPGPTGNINNGNSISSLATGNQFRELQAAAAWYNNYKSQPTKFNNPARQARVQQYLAQYAFALGQAQAILVSGANATNSNGQANNSNSQGWGTPQQQLAMYLHMMRSLQDKITSGGTNSNGSPSSDTNGG